MANEDAIRHHIDVKKQLRVGGLVRPADIDLVIAELAERQHGRVALWQLHELGIGRGAVRRRVERERLRPVSRGVYAVGHRIRSQKATWMEAVLGAGSDACLSHRGAGAGWRVRRSTLIEITTPRVLRHRRGITLHRAVLPRDEVTVVDGIPLTTVPRTIFDLAAILPKRDIERAMHEAEYLRLYDHLSLTDLLQRYPGRRGTRTLRAILYDRDSGTYVSHEEFLDLFLAVIEEAGLPRPETGAWIDGHEIDCVWREQRLMVELDGWAAHGTRRAYERDRARDRRFTRNGWRVIRVTWEALRDEPDVIAADVQALLATPPARPTRGAQPTPRPRRRGGRARTGGR